MRLLNGVAFFLCLIVLTSPAVHAQGFEFDFNAEEIAEGCKAKSTAAADHCVSSLESMADECAARIAAIVEKGQDRRAARVAERCTRVINGSADACVRAIQGGCDFCVALLEYLEADAGLITEVQDHCSLEIARVEDARDAALAVVDAALNS